MSKNIFMSLLVSVFVFSVVSFSFVQSSASATEENKEENQVVISGTIVEIAQDGSYLVVEDNGKKTKFFTSKEFVENEYLEEGDQIKAYGKPDAQGLKLVDYMYDYGEDEFGDEKNVGLEDLPVGSSDAEGSSFSQE